MSGRRMQILGGPIVLPLAALALLLGSACAGQSADELPSPAMVEALPTLDDILDRYVEALGGRDAIERLTTRVAKGDMVTDLPSWTPPVYEVDTLEIYARAPDNYLIITRSARAGTIQEAWRDKTGWTMDSLGVKSLDRKHRSRLAWVLNPQSALHMRDYFSDMTVRCRQLIRGRQVFIVDGDVPLYFSVETGLLMMIGFTELYDYRKVDGVWIPHRIVESRKGGSSTFVLDELKHNEPLDESLFTMP